jgi:hypothetical protein
MYCVSCWITYILQDDTRSIQYQVKHRILNDLPSRKQDTSLTYELRARLSVCLVIVYIPEPRTHNSDVITRQHVGITQVH